MANNEGDEFHSEHEEEEMPEVGLGRFQMQALTRYLERMLQRNQEELHNRLDGMEARMGQVAVPGDRYEDDALSPPRRPNRQQPGEPRR